MNRVTSTRLVKVSAWVASILYSLAALYLLSRIFLIEWTGDHSPRVLSSKSVEGMIVTALLPFVAATWVHSIIIAFKSKEYSALRVLVLFPINTPVYLWAKWKESNQNATVDPAEPGTSVDAPVSHEPADPKPRYQCPCCDYISLPERGDYLVCRICFWEDDGQDIDQLDEKSGPNHGITLREGRANFAEFGACEREMLQHVLPAGKRAEYEHHPRTVA